MSVVVCLLTGGPESSAAFQGPRGLENALLYALGLLNVCSQVLNHCWSLETFSLFPRISLVLVGAWRSTHSVLDPLFGFVLVAAVAGAEVPDFLA